MEFGVFTLGETRLGPDGSLEGDGERLRNLLDGFIADDADEAAELAWPAFNEVLNRIVRARDRPA